MSGYINTAISTEWETPQWLYDKLDSVFHFEYDGACTDANKKAPVACTKEIFRTWDKNTFCNPPYGKEMEYFIRSAALDHKFYHSDIVLLIPSSTEIKSWFDHIWDKAKYIIFLEGRLKFELNGKPAKSCIGKGSAVIVYTDRNIMEDLEALDIGKVIYLKGRG